MDMKTMLLAMGLATVMAAGCARHGARMPDQVPIKKPALHTAQGGILSPGELAGSLATADYLLLGEGHTNACDHMGQATVLRALAEKGCRPVVGLEMVAVDMQPVLDMWNAGGLSVDGLGSRLEWKLRWGHAFGLYRPIFEVCREYGLPLAALNIPRRVVDTIRDGGLEGVAGEDTHFVPDPIIPATKEQRQALGPMLLMHARMGGEKGAGKETFFLVQSLWDTAMAEAAVRVRKESGRMVVILAGAGHVENRWAIAARLRVMDPGAEVVSVMPARSTADMTAREADYYYLCPPSAKKRRLGLVLEARDNRLMIKGVVPGSRAENAGFKPGDVLIRAGERKVTTGIDLHKAALPAAREDRDLVIQVLRKGTVKELVVRF
ncbi:ChaN family lipoprotein [Desulfoplanes sp.]